MFQMQPNFHKLLDCFGLDQLHQMGQNTPNLAAQIQAGQSVLLEPLLEIKDRQIRVLCIGCGNLAPSLYALKHAMQQYQKKHPSAKFGSLDFVGVDIRKQVIEINQKIYSHKKARKHFRGDTIQFVCADICEYQPEDKFDVIIWGNIEASIQWQQRVRQTRAYFDTATVAKIVAFMQESLQPKSVCLLTTPSSIDRDALLSSLKDAATPFASMLAAGFSQKYAAVTLGGKTWDDIDHFCDHEFIAASQPWCDLQQVCSSWLRVAEGLSSLSPGKNKSLESEQNESLENETKNPDINNKSIGTVKLQQKKTSPWCSPCAMFAAVGVVGVVAVGLKTLADPNNDGEMMAPFFPKS